MLIILSQKIDSESTYSDEVYKTYHYPVRYKNQIHEGDIFVYYQGNRYQRDQRYYFGTGIVDRISSEDGRNYYATLKDVRRFKTKVPIYIEEGKYIEQLGYETVRKSLNPPWQSSIRPLSRKAYEYILSAAGISEEQSLEDMKDLMKRHIKDYYLNDNFQSLVEVHKLSEKLIQKLQSG